MCGIAGIVSPRAIPDLQAKAATMARELIHRGPDDAGFLTWGDGVEPELSRSPDQHVGGRLALVHRRLSIVDLSPGGWQPMKRGSAPFSRWIVFNGEIYNYPELKLKLEDRGHVFFTTSDTEVLLAALDEWGIDALSRTVGMYAFAHVDLAKRRLILARDAFGIKPLHYTTSNGQLAFASEIKPLLAIGAGSRNVDRAAVFRYLRHAVTNFAGDTVFADIRELEPGCYIECSLDKPGSITVRRHWSPPRRHALRISPQDAAQELRSLLRESVRLHMRADVRCAAALSGGVDSSGIACLMRRELEASEPLDAFSFEAEDARLSERDFVRLASAASAARVHEIRLDPDQLSAEIDALILSQEQPFNTTSMWAQAHVYRRARAEGYKIVLDGQGADELFAGYSVFRVARLEALIRAGRMSSACSLLAGIPNERGRVILQAMAGLLPDAMRNFARKAIGKSIVPEWIDGFWFEDAAREHRRNLDPTEDPLSAALDDAVRGSSLPMLLRYADRNAMSASVENRVPYLTTRLAEFAFRLPLDLLVGPDGTLKRVLRDAYRDIVPREILDRRNKIGFETPEATWFHKSSVLRSIMSDAAASPLLPCFSERIRGELAAVGRGDVAAEAHHWRAANLIRWSRLFDVDWQPHFGPQAPHPQAPTSFTEHV